MLDSSPHFPQAEAATSSASTAGSYGVALATCSATTTSKCAIPPGARRVARCWPHAKRRRDAGGPEAASIVGCRKIIKGDQLPLHLDSTTLRHFLPGKHTIMFAFDIYSVELRPSPTSPFPRRPSSSPAGAEGWRGYLPDDSDGSSLEIARRYTEHGSGLGRYRWVVERTFAWLYQFKRLLVRYERRADIHEAFLAIGCCLVCYRRLRNLTVR
jgi:Transposase DDE domain